METFKLLNDEKASKAMINLEKKITGYSNMTRMNKPNPDYKILRMVAQEMKP